MQTMSSCVGKRKDQKKEKRKDLCTCVGKSTDRLWKNTWELVRVATSREDARCQGAEWARPLLLTGLYFLKILSCQKKSPCPQSLPRLPRQSVTPSWFPWLSWAMGYLSPWPCDDCLLSISPIRPARLCGDMEIHHSDASSRKVLLQSYS